MRDLGVQLQYNLAATSSYDTLVRRCPVFCKMAGNSARELATSFRQHQVLFVELAVNSDWEMAALLHYAKLLLCELKNSYISLFIIFFIRAKTLHSGVGNIVSVQRLELQTKNSG
jgi:hypothetical protein